VILDVAAVVESEKSRKSCSVRRSAEFCAITKVRCGAVWNDVREGCCYVTAPVGRGAVECREKREQVDGTSRKHKGRKEREEKDETKADARK
jgi:hypothetical protein